MSTPRVTASGTSRRNAHATPSGYPAQSRPPAAMRSSSSASETSTGASANVELTRITSSSRRATAAAVRWAIAKGKTKPSL